ncbi:MAG: methionyl-tRNA formyltransferase [Planctomycetes bacterium]|nr:methionyl-tRNA formyltransferase [Planctomycetota bacterium]
MHSTPRKLDLVFFGAGAFGVPTLARLHQTHTLRAIITQPDRPAGRGGKLTPTPIAEWAAVNAPSLPILKPENVNEPATLAQVRGFSADAWIIIAFGQKLSQPLLADRFAINLHGSILPRWRGAAPVNWAILAGDPIAGNSVITLAERMDAGLVLGTSSRVVTPDLTAGELHDLLSADGPALVAQVLADHAAGTLRPQMQDETRVTKARKLSRADGWIDFKKTATECRNWVHGLTPWPGVKVSIAHQELKVLRVHASEFNHAAQPGTLLDPATGRIACGNSTTLDLVEVQPAGKKSMPWSAFANGRTLTADMVVHSAPDAPPPAKPAEKAGA